MSREIKISAFTLLPVSVKCQAEKHMLVEFRLNIIERRCSINMKNSWIIPPRVLYYIYNVKMLAKAVLLQKHKNVPSATNTAWCLYTPKAKSLTQEVTHNSMIWHTAALGVLIKNTWSAQKNQERPDLNKSEISTVLSTVYITNHHKGGTIKGISVQSSSDVMRWRKKIYVVRCTCQKIIFHIGPSSHQCCQRFNICWTEFSVKKRRKKPNLINFI